MGLNKILAQFNSALKELDAFIKGETEIKKRVEMDIKVLEGNVLSYKKDIDKAGRVKKKLTKLVG